jgi:hypothetical protein
MAAATGKVHEGDQGNLGASPLSHHAARPKSMPNSLVIICEAEPLAQAKQQSAATAKKKAVDRGGDGGRPRRIRSLTGETTGPHGI